MEPSPEMESSFEMEPSPEIAREMALLEHIEQDPDVSQASLATKLGVAVGTVNWHIKRLINKGYVKVKRAERRKLRYIITPEGLAFRARLTVDYVEQQFLLYRRIRSSVREQLTQVKRAGLDRVCIRGDGDIADICRLTCLEVGIKPVDEDHIPEIRVDGLKVVLEMHEGAQITR